MASDDEQSPTPVHEFDIDIEEVEGHDQIEIAGEEELPILPLRNLVTFPNHIQPIQVGRPRSLSALEAASSERPVIGLISQKQEETERPGFDDCYEFGTVALILRREELDSEGGVRILIHGQTRFRITEELSTEPHLRAKVELFEEEEAAGEEIDALKQTVIELFRDFVQLNDTVPDEVLVTARNIKDAGSLCDFIASHAFDLEQRQEILEAIGVRKRLKLAVSQLTEEVEMLRVSRKIQSQVEEEVGKHQREFFLRKKMEEIKKELGEGDSPEMEREEYEEKIEAANMTEEAEEKAYEELDRLTRMHPESAESTVVRTYLDTLIDLPWDEETEDNTDLERARRILDEDHYGLDEIKERLVEYLAVLKLRRQLDGPILCLIGPPGTGKTSLGRSVARALGREFQRISLGGMRDEAEIRGHRRTYVGSMPGRFIQALRKTGTKNPVLLLDEIDKVGQDWRGDPASALLEALDPEQNSEFTDNYLEVPFDLSKVLFICTGNVIDTVHPALKDRMEVIHLSGYTEFEKLNIAKQHLLPKQVELNGLTSQQISFTDAAVRTMINDYTREAGVRNLERTIAKVCRKVAKKVASGETMEESVSIRNIRDYLGVPDHQPSMAEREAERGVATGLAWTAGGGRTMVIEAAKMQGQGDLLLTGQLGDVMQESAKAALSYVRSNAEKLGIEDTDFNKIDVHLHFPAGAVPKDGPSAGITVVAALTSLFSGIKARSDVGMSGEMTLSGRVLPIGGLKQKLLAARRKGITQIILPAENEQDMEDIPDEIKAGMKIAFVEDLEEVLAWCMEEGTGDVRTRSWSKLKAYEPAEGNGDAQTPQPGQSQPRPREVSN